MTKRSFFIFILSLLMLLFSKREAEAFYSSNFANGWNTIVLSMEEGLPHNFVDDLIYDSNGFLWIALQGGGLTRYDGFNFLVYSPNSKYYKTKSTFVTAIAEDKFHRLWVGSDQGIDVIELNTLGNSNLLAAANKNLLKKLDRYISGVFSDEEGRIWIQCDRHLVCVWFDPRTGNIAGSDVMEMPDNSGDNIIFKSKSDHPGIYMSIGNALKRMSMDQNGKITSSPVADELLFEEGTKVTDMLELGNELWVATDHGLYRYDKSERMTRHYQSVPGDTSSLSQNCLTSLALSPDHRVIVGSLMGLNIYNSLRDNFEQVYNLESNPESGGLISNNFVHCINTSNGQIVIGTEGGGVNILKPRMLNARISSYNRGDRNSLSPLPVNSIYFDRNGVEYAGTVEGGLNRRMPGSNSYDHFTVESGALTHNSVSAITGDSDGRLWVGTWGGGLNVLSMANPAVRETVIRKAPGNNDMSFIGVVIPDTINGGVWIGTNRGIWYCDRNLNLSSPLPKNEKSPAGNIGAAISRSGHLWMGGSDGLVIFDLRNRKPDGTFPYRRIREKLDKPGSKLPERVSYVYQDAKGTLWIGSNGNGIYRRVTDKSGKEKFINYNTENGLANNFVRSILDDNTGNLWVATYHGLSCISPDGKIMSYGSKDGIGGAQFYWNAAAKTPNGHLAFGSVDGIVYVDGKLNPVVEPVNPLRFIRLYVGNELTHPGEGHIDSDISVAKTIHLHERDKSFSIEFSALDYGQSSGKNYYYRLYPFEKDWIELPAGRNHVTYTALPSGDYTFEVRYASSPDNIDDATGASIEVEVSPYFYKATWFYLILAFLAAGLIAFYVWHRTRLLTTQNRKLEKVVEQRMHELREADRERRQAEEQIGEQQTQIADMTRRVNELTLDQISFFTNITHEFRTPITLIIGPIQRALRLSTNPKVIEQLSYVERNSKYLLSLVNQLMDFRKMESGKYDIVRTHGNFQRYADEIITPFEAMAAERGITIRRIYHLPDPVITFDEDALRKIFTNLLGNAVKFTPDDGTITVYAALLGENTDCRLYICVSDTGCGIPQSEINNVFDRFFSGKSQMKYPVTGSLGSGIGLYLCKSIIDLYGGKISVRNNPGGCGCSFRIMLPTQRVEIAESDNTLPVPAGDLSKDVAVTTVSAQRPVVLIVEDNPDMRSFIASILRDTYSVVEAENGKEALKILLDRPIDFIVSDLMMPEMDGLELSKRVKENFAISHIPLLILTAKSSNETRLESYRIGVDEFLSKPFDEQILLTRIRNILENKHRYQSRFNIDMDVEALNIADGSRDKRFLDDAMEVVKKNYKNSCFDIGDFAEALGISRSLLNKKLNSLVGQSAVHLIRNYRMNMARELIVRNRKSKAQNISEIAYEVGFNDPKYFTRCFNKHFGISPSTMLSGEDI